MKKIILTLAAIFIATQLFSQTNKNNISINDITKIFITYETYNKYKINDSINGLDLIKNNPHQTNYNRDCYRIFDIKKMKSYYFSDRTLFSTMDIVIFEKLNNNIIHIGVDEPAALAEDEEEDKRIITHHYIDLKKNTSIYSWIWEETERFNALSVAHKSINPKIVIR